MTKKHGQNHCYNVRYELFVYTNNTAIGSIKSSDTSLRYNIKQINYGCPGYTVHIPPSLSGCTLELRMVYEWYILGNHSLFITYKIAIHVMTGSMSRVSLKKMIIWGARGHVHFDV